MLASPTGGDPQRIERLRLHDTVVERLRLLVTEGNLDPGSKINERELCESLGISRTPLREGLKVLAMEGLIVLTPNRGASVATMSETEIREAFEVLSALEGFAGELACKRITSQQLQDIKLLHRQMVDAKAADDLPTYYRCNAAIHDLISEAAHNDTLRQSFLAINRRLQALRFSSNHRAVKWERALADHEEMMEALEQRDGPGLSLILRRHVLDASGRYVNGPDAESPL